MAPSLGFPTTVVLLHPHLQWSSDISKPKYTRNSMNNSSAKERVFNRVKERFVANRKGKVVFSTTTFGTLH